MELAVRQIRTTYYGISSHAVKVVARMIDVGCYLNEFSFCLNNCVSKYSGKLFYRLVQQAFVVYSIALQLRDWGKPQPVGATLAKSVPVWKEVIGNGINVIGNGINGDNYSIV
jgi:hypothetical protein